MSMSQSPLGRHTASASELKERLEVERLGKPFLVYRDGAGSQRIVTLEGDEPVTAGRAEATEVRLDWDSEVSRVHARLEPVAEDWTVVDDGLSRNGSYVNGERVTTRRRLRDGDVLRLGQTAIGFCAPTQAEISATSAATDETPTAASLSDTQRNVLLALCRPYAGAGAFATPATNQVIADEVFLSVDAVKTHMRLLFQKFGIESLPQNQKRARLVERAFQTGLVNQRDL